MRQRARSSPCPRRVAVAPSGTLARQWSEGRVDPEMADWAVRVSAPSCRPRRRASVLSTATPQAAAPESSHASASQSASKASRSAAREQPGPTKASSLSHGPHHRWNAGSAGRDAARRETAKSLGTGARPGESYRPRVTIPAAPRIRPRPESRGATWRSARLTVPGSTGRAASRRRRPRPWPSRSSPRPRWRPKPAGAGSPRKPGPRPSTRTAPGRCASCCSPSPSLPCHASGNRGS